MCERSIAEYEEELSPTKETERQHQLLDAVFKKHQVVLHRTGVQQRLHIKEEEEEPQPPHIKEEEEEVWITQEGECLPGQQKADLTKFPLTVVSLKTEDHEDKPPESSHLQHSPNVLEKHLLPEQQEWSFRMEQGEPHPSRNKEEDDAPQSLHIKEEEENPLTPHFKEEEEEHSISQASPVIGVIVKSEDDEVKGESEDKREAEPPSSSSTQHLTTEADGDHCGGSQADKILAPLSDSDDTTSHSPDTDDEDSKDDKTCHTDNTRFKCSHCPKTFRFRCTLITHVRKHTGEKPFLCSVCSGRFSTKYTLEKHTLIHTGEKPFICSVCCKGYRQRHDWKVHMRTHTEEKVLSCSVCGERFSSKYQCKKHRCAGENSSSWGGNVAQMVVWPCQPTQGCWFVTSVHHPSHGCSVLVPSTPTLYATTGSLMLSVADETKSSNP
ncbi:zinc finger and SCAN domain-containing protein 31-like [Entelurus aequoreus]|uniref:zinc finger and SCAN domain-containing protein 31-like n=1 Tax=Entelurus aequoreus TaxID=161455 RepID=UPI002B1E734D|nr:zinc finger and SCAN domain-containing protein 31-like [Entelurus aequoreus]